MKKLLSGIIVASFILAAITSCKKSYMGEIDAIKPMLYLTPVQAGVISLNKERVTFSSDSSLVNVILGVARSGTQKASACKVSVAIESTNLPAGAIPLPNSILKQAQVDISGDSGSGTFELQIPVSMLKSNLGKHLAARLSITNSSSYEINPSLSSAVVLLDVSKFFK